MVEYYRVSLLIKTEYGKFWDKIYLGVNDEESDIILYPLPETRPLDSKIEEVSEEEAIGFLERC